jgi:hypothetical protein
MALCLTVWKSPPAFARPVQRVPEPRCWPLSELRATGRSPDQSWHCSVRDLLVAPPEPLSLILPD